MGNAQSAQEQAAAELGALRAQVVHLEAQVNALSRARAETEARLARLEKRDVLGLGGGGRPHGAPGDDDDTDAVL